MKRLIFGFIFLVSVFASSSWAVVPLTEKDWQILKQFARGGGGSGVAQGPSFPGSPTTDTLFFLTTDTSAHACSAGSGTVRTLCYYDGATWLPVFFNTIPSLDAAFDVGNEMNSATSATPLIVGNGTQKLDIFGDATLGGVIRPNPLGNSVWRCWSGFNCLLRDEAAGTTMWTINPAAANANSMYQIATNYRMKKSVWIGAGALEGDGTNCAASSSAVTINSGPKVETIVCADNDASRLQGSVLMPNDWDGGTLTFTQVVVQTAANTSALNGDVAAQCRGTGETPTSTYGTEVAMNIASLGGSNKNDMVTSAAVTPTGTCAANDMLYFYYDVNAAGTTTAMGTLHTLGFRITYTVNSLSQ